jgi:hypothetical protein
LKVYKRERRRMREKKEAGPNLKKQKAKNLD